MKVLYIHQYFKTPEEGGAIRSYYLATGLAENGYDVEMITSHGYKESITKSIDGIKIHYLPVAYQNKFGFIRRIYAFIKFLWLAFKKAKEIKDVDIVYATSTPLTIGLLALWIKKKFKIPFYFEVRDLWPEAPIQMGVVRNGLLKRLLVKLEKTIYQEADKIIALSPGIRDGIKKISPQKSVYVIPNMSDCDFFNIEAKEKRLEKKFKVEKRFVITYFGAIGKVNHLDYFLDFVEAAKKKHLKLSFIIAGQGSEVKRLKKNARLRHLNALQFLPFQNKEGIREVLNITDAVYISFANKPILQTNSPNKFFDALAAGKLIITNTNGWVREISESHRCGFYYNPENPRQIIDKLKPIVNDRNYLLSFQNNSRSMAELYYSKELQVQKLLKVFNNEHQMRINDSSVYILTA
ncbi:glycosyltransferase family 4 protein [Fulvivirgaceae bacterium BMA10]|uniref:Glycosyltransferase family 4 protein n=1 Tax=Splendidivirga corallicola TaxID=3051826 RepID=A0ABT8KWT1_9BACT|nr:glycosyltransferase family 4 protein [Fulvivirgaceae bacterium BMA10]